jgi:hypothetical protein
VPPLPEAAAAARRVAGVTKVHNHLQVVLADADCRDDAWLTTEANNALTLNVTVPDGVEADARDGNLTLTELGEDAVQVRSAPSASSKRPAASSGSSASSARACRSPTAMPVPGCRPAAALAARWHTLGRRAYPRPDG